MLFRSAQYFKLKSEHKDQEAEQVLQSGIELHEEVEKELVDFAIFSTLNRIN